MKLRNAFSFAAILAVVLSTTALAATEKAKMGGAVGVFSGCDAEFVNTSGNLLLEVATNPDGSTTVKLQYKGLGANESGVTYKTELNGEGTFETSSSVYSIPYSGTFVGKPPVQSFDMFGLVDVYVDGNGVPTGATIQTVNTACIG